MLNKIYAEFAPRLRYFQPAKIPKITSAVPNRAMMVVLQPSISAVRPVASIDEAALAIGERTIAAPKFAPSP